jgi:hypothetical protein
MIKTAAYPRYCDMPLEERYLTKFVFGAHDCNEWSPPSTRTEIRRDVWRALVAHMHTTQEFGQWNYFLEQAVYEMWEAFVILNCSRCTCEDNACGDIEPNDALEMESHLRQSYWWMQQATHHLLAHTKYVGRSARFCIKWGKDNGYVSVAWANVFMKVREHVEAKMQDEVEYNGSILTHITSLYGIKI